ncbi:putative secreted protein (Por secretion system target) [Winogradskyella pacifica]|uniref:Putative secreted protein (Por secretion system target) n=1 Tax=Winogradskyella pacifica TaxID=664642 RepID=A0A3D9N2A9_9FLAO|nr:Ig-like domain-containing protein [Winogradskyella pacifica]REE25799.1 putative secreted protein (Por secretion system target) [Winogradskyella pacifica]
MNKIIYFLLIIPFLSLSQQKAFPTAYGGGAYASGGRVGNVYHVTSLSDDNTVGTFRWALSQPRPSTIVFDVSGIINLLTPLQINGNDLTIAGQTAPTGGVTLTYPAEGKLSYGDAQNIIMRYIRVRPQYQGDTALSIFPGNSEGDEASNLIFDHISISYAGLQGFSMRGKETKNITFQHGIIAESKTGSLFGDTDTANFSYDNTFRTTMFYNVGQRTPNTSSGRADVYNNVVYQWINRLTTVKVNSHINHFNNYYFLGSRVSLWYQYQSNPKMWFVNGATNEHPEFPFNIYTKGNIVQDLFTDPEADNQYLWIEHAYSSQTERVDPSFFTDVKFPMIGAVPEEMTAVEASIAVPLDSGAYKFLNADGSVGIYRDPQDARYVNNVINDTPEFFDNYGYGESGSYHSASEEQPYLDFLAAISTTPVNTREEGFYVSNEHIPEIWFQANVPTGQNHNDIAPSGYTWLEEYLNGVDADSETSAIGVESIAVTPATAELQISETLQLTVTITPSNASNQSGEWTSSDESIATVDSNGLVTPVSFGDVTITFITNDGGFTDTSEITVFPEALQASAGTDQQICQGESVTLTASGGISYVWSTGETTESIEVTPNATITYTVTVSDDFGQSEEASVTVTVNSIPLVNAGEDQTICLGQSATLVATGGVSYLWNTGETTASIEVNPSVETSYSVEVSNENCSSIDEVTVFVAEIPNITISEDIVIIESETTTLTATGGENYEWSTGETTESIEVNPTETTIYTVSSVSENGCVSSANVTVTVIAEIIADAGEDITICNGEFVTLSASGGSTYLWNTGDSGSELIINPTITTTYTVIVEDEYGYTKDDSVTVFVNESPNITVGDDVFIMIGDSTTLTANGGNNFVWSTGETTDEISVSPDVTTTYIVTGFSENGCQNTAEVTVTVVEELNANAGEDVSICLGESVTLNASGGITYIWNTGGSGATPTVTPTETTAYTVTITDGFGNSDTDDVIVTVNPLPIANAGENQTICVGEFVNLTAEGGDTYLWSTGETTANITVNPNEDTIYTVETFSNNCSDSADVTVFVSTMPEVVVSEDVTIVTGSSTTLLVSGGDSYLWNTGDTSNSIEVSPIETTTYSVTGFSANGCQSVAEVTVTVIAEVNADAGNDVAICFGESVTLNASGGINYTWSTGEAGASLTLSPTETTTYTVTVTDSFGNSDTDSVTVIVNELPTITISESITIIEGDSTNLLVSGAESYLWNTGDTSNSILVSPSQTTTYSVVGTTNSCSSELKEVTVKVTPLFRASAGTDERVCDNQNYEVVLTANEGDSYLWSTGETSQSIVVNPLSTSTYSVTVTQGDQSDTDDVKVYVDPSPVVTIANGESVEILSGDFVTLSASGANTYRWNNGASQPNIAVSPSITTTYEIKGFIGECYDEKQVTVNVLNRVNADAGEDVFACLEDVSTLTASGGDDYIWSTGETTQTIEVSPTETTDYTVTVFNALDFDEATVRVEVDVNCGIDSTNPVEEETEFAFDVYPNPASGIVNVKISGSLIVSDINIFDVTGKLVQYIKITNENLNPSTTTQVDISSLQAGVYFIKLNNKDRNITKKLIVK